MMLPPRVAMFRIWGEAVAPAAWATAGRRFLTSGWTDRSYSVSPAPRYTYPSSSRIPLSSSTWWRKMRVRSSRAWFFSSGIRSVPPPT